MSPATEPLDPSPEVIGEIPGVSRVEAHYGTVLVVREDAQVLTLTYHLGLQCPEWLVRGTLPPPTFPTRTSGWWTVVAPAGLLALLGAWSIPGAAQSQRMTQVARMINRHAQRVREPAAMTPAQRAFGLGGIGVYPTHPDGRFEFAGCVEPYPGAWPRRLVREAASGDPSTLWPYLTTPKGDL